MAVGFLALLASGCSDEAARTAARAAVSPEVSRSSVVPETPAAPSDSPAASPADPSPQPSPAEPSPPAPSPKPRPRNRGRVTDVVDGDTIKVSLRGVQVTVRFIGIDTPETVHPSEPVECFGAEASAFTTRWLLGSRVRLEYDVERYDRYERILAYVWKNGELFNRSLVSQGYAMVATYPPNVKYVDVFLAAQREARSGARGLWGGCSLDPEPASPAPAGPPAAGGSPGCDSSYPDVCIPRYPPDLDCAEIAHGGFRVTGPDLHGFDGDGDGVGCE